MSRCGGCDLYWPNGKENFGVFCPGDCEPEECANNLCRLVFKLRAALEQSEKKAAKQDLTTKIYGIFSGAYSDWSIHGYFSSAEDAFKYCAEQNEKLKCESYDSFYPLEIPCLDGTPICPPKFKYKYRFVFRRDKKEKCWLADDFEYNNIGISEKEEPSPSIQDKQNGVYPWISVTVYLKSINIERAKKIAQDYLYMYLAEHL